MSQNVMDTLRARGFIKQTVYEDELYEKLGSESVPFYIGFDPTADSLHVGHFMQLIAMRHMQDAGHKPIILIGGGTGMIGDPSGRTDMRSMMTRETVKYHVECFKKQMSRFIRFEGENGAIIVDNADWLLDLNYIDFLREIGANFSVNKMLTRSATVPAWKRGSPSSNLTICSCRRMTFWCSSASTAASSSWAATTSGATFWRAPTSSAARSRSLPLR